MPKAVGNISLARPWYILLRSKERKDFKTCMVQEALSKEAHILGMSSAETVEPAGYCKKTLVKMRAFAVKGRLGDEVRMGIQNSMSLHLSR